MSYATDQLNTKLVTKMGMQLQTNSDYFLALQDMFNGITNYKFWSYMGFAEIGRRYRRTLIGPFWTTLSLGIFIGCMGPMLSILWHTNPKEFLPYFCAGYITWTLIQSIITEGCNNFISATPFIRQVPIPYTTYACIVTWRNLIVFAHHIVILLLVFLYAHLTLNINVLFLIPGLGLIFFTGTWVSIFLGMICTRYRDIQQVISSMLQLAMYITPIMWQPDQLGKLAKVINGINPLYHFICIIKQPLLGASPDPINWIYTILFSLIGAICTLLLLAKNYRKLVFWL